MQRFVVIFRDADQESLPTFTAKVERTFEKRHKIGLGAWVIATESEMPHEVCQKLGMTSPDSPIPGFVGRLDEYNGWMERDLWEKLRQWH